MNLRVLLPSGIFVDKANVSRIVAESKEGSFGLLPHRLDCVAALVPGILTYQDPDEGEKFIGVDEGILVKAGQEVLVSVRQAITDPDLGRLRTSLEREFTVLDEEERSVRSAMTKLETGLLRRLVMLDHE